MLFPVRIPTPPIRTYTSTPRCARTVTAVHVARRRVDAEKRTGMVSAERALPSGGDNPSVVRHPSW